jgi:hypothetical protein
MNVYVPGVLNVHSPCQLVAPVGSVAATGIPVQLGVAGPPVNFRPWCVSLYGLLKFTTPPGPTVAVAGIQEWEPYTPGSLYAEMLGVSELAIVGATAADAPSRATRGR